MLRLEVQASQSETERFSLCGFLFGHQAEILSLLLGLKHGLVCTVEQNADFSAMFRIHGNADTGPPQ